jgi:hypothetical protein
MTGRCHGRYSELVSLGSFAPSFLPFRQAFRVPESGRSGQGVSSVRKGVVFRQSASGPADLKADML